MDGEDEEDLQELEARLYAQIHYESELDNEAGSVKPRAAEHAASPHLADASKVPMNRYWVLGSRSINYKDNNKLGTTSTLKAAALLPPLKPKETVIATSAQTKQPPTNKSSIGNGNNNKNAKLLNDATNMQSRELRINPASVAAKQQRKKKNKPKKQPQQPAPFVEKLQKLQKHERIDAKRQKTKYVQQKAKQLQQQQQQQKKLNTIVLLTTSDESENDDVVLVPLPPPPIITVVDTSDDGESATSDEQSPRVEQAAFAIDENAMDATFVRPHASGGTAGGSAVADKTTGDSVSRCTSPCSVISSDDFIGAVDRTRLQQTVAADDEDLLHLTADVDSLMELAPPAAAAGEQRDNEEESSLEVEFVVPPITASAANTNNNNQYRVDQTQFRAHDVYDESESDITDSVYSKGRGTASAKPTVIRSLASSSEESVAAAAEPIEHDGSAKMKRLRKRRISSGNKETPVDSSDDCDEVHAPEVEAGEQENGCMDIGDRGVTPSGVPFIARGQAVERRRHSMSSAAANRRRRVSVPAGSSAGRSGHMSDHEFITTLNTLAQGSQAADADEDSDDEEEDELVKAPTARSMVEQVLEKQRSRDEAVAIVTDISKPTALLPDGKLAALHDIFNTIDQLGLPKHQQSQTDVDEAESSPEVIDDDDAEDNADDALPNTSNAVAMETAGPSNDADHPIYNVVYSRDKHFTGGIGWNDEMRRFYNDSWNGEQFRLRDIWQRLNPAKQFWKIYTADRFPQERAGRTNKHMKCKNCCEFGHTRAHCQRPRKPPVCYICGEHGHQEPRCPHTLCLRCGHKTRVFTKSCNICTFQNRLICPLCKVRGHTLQTCPDKWRRYHSTTTINIYPVCSGLEYNTKQYCCICGKRGHLSETCRSAVRFMEYPTIVSAIRSHQKTYDDIAVDSTQRIAGLAYNLLYTPRNDFTFELAEGIKRDSYYGRFLTAVSMSFVLKRKRRPIEVEDVDAAASKQAKRLAAPYKANPQAQVGRKVTVPEQVPVVSKSGIRDGDFIDLEDNEDDDGGEQAVVAVVATIEPSDTDITPSVAVEIEVQAASSTAVTAASSTAEEQFKTPNRGANTPNIVLPMDSDSNYSFSEHFEELPTSTPPTAPALAPSLAPSPPMATASAPASSPQMGIEAAQPPPMRKSREMAPLPDFIPIGGSGADDVDEVALQAGISRRYVTANTDDEESDEIEGVGRSGVNSIGEQLPDIPCEAKIYLTHFHSKYLLSPVGHKFLVEKSNRCEIKARLDFTSVGHVLVIFGLPAKQDQFHRELLHKYRELTEQMQRQRLDTTAQKVPKRADVLIRFLREQINQLLLPNLGNANELLHRMRLSDEQHEPSKAIYKMGERARRTLNMILLGQAGLNDGGRHLDKLLFNLKTLINDYRADEAVSIELRTEIDAHWKMIFTPIIHENYPALVQTYNRLPTKSRLPKLNIDPALLGVRVLDTTLTAEQKERLQQPQRQQQRVTPKAKTGIVPNPLNSRNAKLLHKRQQQQQQQQSQQQARSRSMTPPPAPSLKLAIVLTPTKAPPAPSLKLPVVLTPTKAPPAPSMRINMNTVPPIAAAKSAPTVAATMLTHQSQQASFTAITKWQQQVAPPPFLNAEQKSIAAAQMKQATNSENFNELLTAIVGSSGSNDVNNSSSNNNKSTVRVSKGPSMFWSRECIRYLDECIKLAEANATLLEKLERVQKKSQSGHLSYNDYRAVIKLHSVMLGK